MASNRKLKMSDRISTGVLSAVIGYITFLMIQFFVLIRVFPKYSSDEVFIDNNYAFVFAIFLFLVGFMIGSKKMARVLGFVFRTNR
ncbi:hypothetical protein Kalk_20760 [Ketobacter alkanivorans]|uniref:Uncharacterized protein n=1 Tax=Ketobacter alkanivorans TaxID=1917421 RepID=A0A2K9LR38_9GAMM|nr:hypothetical protein Kalk_20760 [Ketobacter alkanivorans]